MSRSAAERRHHRERVIQNRVVLAEMFGDPEKPGRFSKTRKVNWQTDDPRVRGSYIAPGYQKHDWWDGGMCYSVRLRMKRDLRNEVENCA